MKFILNDNFVKDKMKEFSITKKDIEKRMHQVFSYKPKDYDFVDTTINKNNHIYRIQFGICDINDDSIEIECLYLSDPSQKIKSPTIKEICLEKAKKQNKQPV